MGGVVKKGKGEKKSTGRYMVVGAAEQKVLKGNNGRYTGRGRVRGKGSGSFGRPGENEANLRLYRYGLDENLP